MGLKLQGTVAVSTPALALVRHSSFALTIKPDVKKALAIRIATGERADPDVDRWVRAEVAARHTGGSIVSEPGKAPYFELIKREHAALYRLVWFQGGRFGAMPTIVHGYAPFQ